MKYFIYFLIALVFACAIMAPLFADNKILFDGDVVTYDYPALNFYSGSIASGQSLDWNPYYMGGFPTRISPVGDYFDPFIRLLLALKLTGFTVLSLRLVFSIAFGLLAAFFFARKSGLSEGASIIVALSYLVAQTLTGMVAGLGFSGVFFVLPTLLLLIRLVREGKSFPLVVALGSLLLGYAWLAGFVQIVFYCYLFAFVYALYLSLKERKSSFFNRYKPVIALVIIAGISVLLALPFLSDTLVFRDLTPRVSGFGSDISETMEIGQLMHFFLPYFFSIPYVVGGFVPGLYFGAFAFICGIVGILHVNRRKELNGLFFLGMYLAVFLFGSTWFGVSNLIQKLPVFSVFHTLTRALMPGSLFFAYLAGYGFDILRLRDFSERRIRYLLLLSSLFIGFVFLFFIGLNTCFYYCGLKDPNRLHAFLSFVFTHLGKDQTRLLTNGAYYISVFKLLLDRIVDSYSLLNWRFSAPLFFIFSSIFLVFVFVKRRISEKTFITLAVLTLTLNVFLTYASEFQKYISKDEVTKEPVIAKIIHADPGASGQYLSSFLVGDASFRLSSLTRVPTPDEQFMLQREGMTQNTNIYSQIPRLDGYEPFLTVRQKHLWSDIIANETLVVKSATVTDAIQTKKKEFLSLLPLLSSYSVGYIVSGYSLDDARLKPIPLTTPASITLYLYKNLEAQPIVYIPERIVAVPSWDDSYFDEIAQNKTNTVYVECGRCSGGVQTGQVSGVTFSNARLFFTVSVPQTTFVVISHSNLPGWEALIDGKPVSIMSANYIMQAISVPAGVHMVTFTYTSAARAHGGILASFARFLY